MVKTVDVVISHATRTFDKRYTYIVPEGFENIEKGMRLEVPFGASNKKTEAFVFSVGETVDVRSLKPVLAIRDRTIFLDENTLALVEYVKKTTICTYYDALKIMFPIFSKAAKGKKEKWVSLLKQPQEVMEDLDAHCFRSVYQIRVLELLLEMDEIPMHELLLLGGVSRSVVDTLKKNGYVTFFEKEILRDPLMELQVERDTPKKPTEEQQAVLRELRGCLEKKAFHEHLIVGVTGSGKTEVYLQLIQMVLEAGNEAILLVPEISLTPQIVRRFKARFGDVVSVYHSRLSPGERYDQWRKCSSGEVRVLVGARSAVFAPFKHLGMIVIDEEHEATYKSEVTPKYDARDIARKRCEMEGAMLVLGSATPSIESFYRAKEGEIGCSYLKMRPQASVLPTVEVVDMRKEFLEGNKEMFSRRLQTILQETIQKNEQAILFMNRRGFSTSLMCRTCGDVIECAHCKVSMTFHLKSHRLICHYCGYTIPMPSACPKCAHTTIKEFGVGTQKVEEETQKKFAVEVIRVDLDTTARKNAHQQLFSRFETQNIPVMIGTQMIAKGHDFPNVTFVGVLLADGLLHTGDFRSGERTFQLLTQVAGRAGRGSKEGRVVIQSYNIDHYSILYALNHDYDGFYQQEILFRKNLGYPPFAKIGTLLLTGMSDAKTEKAIYDLKEVCIQIGRQMMRSSEPMQDAYDFQISKPLRAPIARIKDRYRWRLVLKSVHREGLCALLSQVSDYFYRKKRIDDVELSVDINPYHML